jgi:hypothetical protein
MQKNPAVCNATRTLLCAAGLALYACSSKQLPPLPGRAEVPSQFQPPPPLYLSGGQAVKAFIDPLTGELRDPREVELVVPPVFGGNPQPASDQLGARWVELRDHGDETTAVPGLATAPSECGKAEGRPSAAYRCRFDQSPRR